MKNEKLTEEGLQQAIDQIAYKMATSSFKYGADLAGGIPRDFDTEILPFLDGITEICDKIIEMSGYPDEVIISRIEDKIDEYNEELFNLNFTHVFGL